MLMRKTESLKAVEPPLGAAEAREEALPRLEALPRSLLVSGGAALVRSLSLREGLSGWGLAPNRIADQLPWLPLGAGGTGQAHSVAPLNHCLATCQNLRGAFLDAEGAAEAVAQVRSASLLNCCLATHWNPRGAVPEMVGSGARVGMGGGGAMGSSLIPAGAFSGPHTATEARPIYDRLPLLTAAGDCVAWQPG